MNSIKELKKIYDKLDFTTEGLDNRIIAAYGLNILLIVFPMLICPLIGIMVFPLIIQLMTTPIGLAYIIVKIITKYLTPKFKMPNPNISIYLLAAIFFASPCYLLIINNPISCIKTLGLTILIALPFKIPFLPECKLKRLQEKLEKNVIKISFIAFFILFIPSIFNMFDIFYMITQIFKHIPL